MRNDHLQSNHEAFMEYYEKYHDDIFRFCMLKTNNRDQALDTTQECFIKFWEYMIKGSTIDNHRALLYKIARNLIIDGYRKKQSFSLASYQDQDIKSINKDLSYNPQQGMEDHIDGALALSILDQLPSLIKEIITLKYVNGLSVTEIASIVDRDSKTVSVYLHRGIKKLREIITHHET